MSWNMSILSNKVFLKETNKSNRFLFLLLERGEIDLDNKIKHLKEHHNFSVSKLRFYWEQMLEAVKECHIRGIIHTDIKPSNFVLVKGQLKIIDFGFAIKLEPGQTSTRKNLVGGTRQFMSPEIAAMINQSTNVNGKVLKNERNIRTQKFEFLVLTDLVQETI